MVRDQVGAGRGVGGGALGEKRNGEREGAGAS